MNNKRKRTYWWMLVLLFIFLELAFYLVITIFNDLDIIHTLNNNSTYLVYYEQRVSIYGTFLTVIATIAAIIGAFLGINIQVENSNNQLKDQNKTDLIAKFSMDKIKDAQKLSNSFISLYQQSLDILDLIKYSKGFSKNVFHDKLMNYNDYLESFWFEEVLKANRTVTSDLREELLTFNDYRTDIIISINNFLAYGKGTQQSISDNVQKLKEYIYPDYLFYDEEKAKNTLFAKIMNEEKRLSDEINDYIDKK